LENKDKSLTHFSLELGLNQLCTLLSVLYPYYDTEIFVDAKPEVYNSVPEFIKPRVFVVSESYMSNLTFSGLTDKARRLTELYNVEVIIFDPLR